MKRELRAGEWVNGKGTEISTPVIDAILRRLDISKTDFWGLPEKPDKKLTPRMRDYIQH